ncbi:MAG: DUF3696 domain-containing protein, partial [bacterium]
FQELTHASLELVQLLGLSPQEQMESVTQLLADGKIAAQLYDRVILPSHSALLAALQDVEHIRALRGRPTAFRDPGPNIITSSYLTEAPMRGMSEEVEKELLSVDVWLRRLGFEYSIHNIEDEHPEGSYLLLDNAQNMFGLSEVGFGVTQVLPILMAASRVKPDSIIIVEQPEIHLHPRAQANLADVFLESLCADETERVSVGLEGRGQWILETHSEALMLRFQKRIREKRLRPEDLSVLYVKPSPEGSTITQLRLDDDGEFIDEWPDGFFEESYDELFGGA